MQIEEHARECSAVLVRMESLREATRTAQRLLPGLPEVQVSLERRVPWRQFRELKNLRGRRVVASHLRKPERETLQKKFGFASVDKLGPPRRGSSDEHRELLTMSVGSILRDAQERGPQLSLPNVVRALVKRCNSEEGRLRLDEWMCNKAMAKWANELLLAAAMEAGAQLDVASALGVMIATLANSSAHETAVVVAAQRLRLFPVEPRDTRDRVFRSLLGRIDVWEKAEELHENAVLAIPSLPWVGGNQATAWLTERVRTAPVAIAWSASQATLDWASGADGRFEPMEDAARHALLATTIDRCRSVGEQPPGEARFDLRASLVWLLGALATPERLEEVASLLAGAFERAHGLEDAAALRAGRLIARRLGTDAFRRACDSSFGSPALKDRYLHLVFNVR
jgi:hypothetical protein